MGNGHGQRQDPQPAPCSEGSTELAAWLTLLEAPGVGRQTVRRLLATFGSPQGALAATAAGHPAGLSAESLAFLRAPPASLHTLVERTRAWLAEDAARRVLTVGDAAYPASLLESPDPPLLLYAQGRLALLQRPMLAIVGSRHPTPQGRETARAFAQDLAGAGLTVCSGLAEGIDGAAHEGALDAVAPTVGGHPQGVSTVAVVGTGLDRIYPRHHAALARRIAAEGLLLSEFPLGTPALAANFPRRNRIIAGLSLGTLVVEAAVQSGSLITARLAAEAGREVFAVPGSIHAPQSRGCHALIKQGAQLVESIDDIRQGLGLAWPAAAAPLVPAPTPVGDTTGAEGLVDEAKPGVGGLPAATTGQAADDRAALARLGTASPDAAAAVPDADPVLRALGWNATSLETLLQRTGLSLSELSVRLLGLELEGQVERLPGESFQRIVRA